MTLIAPARAPSRDEMTLSEAARLVSQPKAYLRELAAAGRLAVYLTGDPANPKWRVSKAGLSEAGLLARERDDPADGTAESLIGLVKAQAERIAALEDQRFQLGAQLGAAMERIAALEESDAERELASYFRPPASPEISERGRAGAMRKAASQRGVAGLRRWSQFGARLLTGRLRLPARLQDDSLSS
jgi:hypothetical protein